MPTICNVVEVRYQPEKDDCIEHRIAENIPEEEAKAILMKEDRPLYMYIPGTADTWYQEVQNRKCKHEYTKIKDK